MSRASELILGFVLSALLASMAYAAPGGPQAVIYYSDGLKLLKPKLYLTDGTLVFSSVTSAGSYGNVGFGGATASSSDSYPVLIERTLANALIMQISNPSSDSAASAKIQLSTDAGDKLGELGIFPNEAVTAAYSAAMTVRPNGNATRLSLIGGDLATGHVAFYTAGDYAATGEALRVNADKSIQFMQQIATPATPASGSGKLYVKADDDLYFLNDNGTEVQLGGSAQWFVHATLGGANPSLGVAGVGSDTEITNASLTLTPVSGSAAAGTVCSTTSAATVASTSPTVCAAGSEGLGISFTPAASGWHEICAQFSPRVTVDTGEIVAAYFKLARTPTNAQTISAAGALTQTFYCAGMTIATGTGASCGSPIRLCDLFNLTSGAAVAMRLFYQQGVGGTPNESIIVMDADGTGRNMTWTARRL
jgi:hypothetical protein